MNYFAHAVRDLDRPYFIAGTAVPDWLNVVDRKVRVRRRLIDRHLGEFTGEDREVALGIRQHLDDDHWFHTTPGFHAVTGELARAFRRVLGEEDAWRCGFLGHIVTELLLDAVLIDQAPARLAKYYEVLSGVDPQRVQQVVARVATAEPVDLSRFIGLYLRERFLEDYLDDRRLLHRLNQVMHRVGLAQLPETTLDALAEGRKTVRRNLGDLLPETEFGPVPTVRPPANR